MESIGFSVQEKKQKIDFQDSDHSGHLGFPIGTILSILFIYKSPQGFLPSIESIGLSVQEKKRKIDFQNGSHGGHLGFQIGTILAVSDLRHASYKVLSQLPFKFRRRSERQTFKMAANGHFGFSIGTILAIIDLQVTLMLPIKFGINWPFG